MTCLRPAGVARHLDSLGPWVALGILALVFGLGVRSTMVVVANTAWVEHTHLVIESLDDVNLGLSEAINARRGYSLTGDVEHLDDYVKAVTDLTAAKMTVRLLTSDNVKQQRRLDRLDQLLAARLVRLGAALDDRRLHGFDAERETRITREGTVAYRELAAHVEELIGAESRLLAERQRASRLSLVRTEVSAVVGALASLTLLVAVLVRLRREIRRRQQSERAVHDNQQVIASLNQDLERRIEARTAQLKAANDELESFSYSVVHDLRAPLRGMGGFARILLDDCAEDLGADTRDCLREIQQNANKMASLIDALVAMARTTRREMKVSTVDISGLVQAVATELAAAGAGPTPVVVVEDNLRADADPSLARQLVEILLGNCWKFARNTTLARINVGVKEMDGERAWFVRDNGAGFDMAHAAKLFAPFGRLHTVDEFQGLGIGLATAQRIVQRHGGRIWADGHVGQGAVFYFTLGPAPQRGTT